MSQIATPTSGGNPPNPQEKRGQKLGMSINHLLENDTLDDLKRVPITTSSGQIVYLEDISNVYQAKKNRGGISSYNGQETISISISKQQSSTAMDVSCRVRKTIDSWKRRTRT